MRGILAVLIVGAMLVVGCGSATSPMSIAQPKTGAQQSDGRPAESVTAAKPTAGPASAPQMAATPASSGAATGVAAKPAATAGSAGDLARAAPAVEAKPANAQPSRPQPPVPTPAAQPAPGGPAQPAPVVPAGPARMVIYTTEIGILVKSLAESVQAMSDVATSVGGYVSGVENKDENGRPLVTVGLKVPPDRYEQVMRQLRNLAVEVTDEKAATQDVSEEFSDVQTQLAALEASHAQLLELLGKAQNVDEVLKVQERLTQTKTQIDRLKGRQNFLQRNADLATVTVRARQADDVLARSYVALRTALRRAEGQKAATLVALERARTPEEEAKLRDQLAETTVELERTATRMRDVEGKAQSIGLALPVAADPAPAVSPQGEDALKEQHLDLRVQLRRAQYEVDRLTRELQQRGNPDDAQLRQQLQASILERDKVEGRLRVVQERAKQAGVALPTISPELEAALTGVPVEATSDVGRAARMAWDASLRVLGQVAVVMVGAVVFLWWALPLFALAGVAAWRRRRGGTVSPPTPAAP